MASPPTFSHVLPLSPPTKYKYMQPLSAVATPAAPSSPDAPARMLVYAGRTWPGRTYYVRAASPGCPDMASYLCTWCSQCSSSPVQRCNDTLPETRARPVAPRTDVTGRQPAQASLQAAVLTSRARGRGLPAGTCSYGPESERSLRIRVPDAFSPIHVRSPGSRLPSICQPASTSPRRGRGMHNAECASVRIRYETKRPCPPNLRPGLGPTDSVALRVASGSWGADTCTVSMSLISPLQLGGPETPDWRLEER